MKYELTDDNRALVEYFVKEALKEKAEVPKGYVLVPKEELDDMLEMLEDIKRLVKFYKGEE